VENNLKISPPLAGGDKGEGDLNPFTPALALHPSRGRG